MKGIIRRLRPSPAMVVACIALLFAMTGAGYAAGMLGPNTVGTKQLKKNAVISSKVKNRSLLAVDFKAGQLPAGPPGAPGAPGAPGQQGPPGPGARWASIQPSGVITRQSGGITVTNGPIAGQYIVDFGSDVSRQLILASAGFVSDAQFRGGVIAGSCTDASVPAGFCGANPQNKAVIVTDNAANNSQQPHGFFIAAMGPDAPSSAGPAGGSMKLPGRAPLFER
jgi:hypothetical protein